MSIVNAALQWLGWSAPPVQTQRTWEIPVVTLGACSFKVGDRVACVNPHGGKLLIGSVKMVVPYYGGYYHLYVHDPKTPTIAWYVVSEMEAVKL